MIYTIDHMVLKFLKDKRDSDGGWAEVTEIDMLLLNGIVEQLIAEKFQEDPDGDLPVEYKLINRTTHQRMHFLPLKNLDFDDGLKALIAQVKDAQVNLSIATDQVRCAVGRLDLRKGEE